MYAAIIMMCLVKVFPFFVLVATLQGACASFENIKTFTPLTRVSDQVRVEIFESGIGGSLPYLTSNLTWCCLLASRYQKLAISHDQTVLESLLVVGTEQSFDQAQRVYSDGGNSKTIATLTLAGGLPVNVAKGTKLTAKGFDARDVVGTCENSAVIGSTMIQFKYPTTDNMQNHLDCRVGGLPAPEQFIAGCKLMQTVEQCVNLYVED